MNDDKDLPGPADLAGPHPMSKRDKAPRQADRGWNSVGIVRCSKLTRARTFRNFNWWSARGLSFRLDLSFGHRRIG
mgnify:CR=1 FL=1